MSSTADPTSFFPGPNPTHELPADPKHRANVEHVLEHGYVVLRNAFSKQEAEDAKAEMRRLGGTRPKKGRNPFEGTATNRIYSLLNKTRAFDRFCMLPEVLALNDYFLNPGYMVSVLHTIQINPGEEAQALHHDDGYCHLPRPRPPLGAAILVAFDDFTPENGATRVVPGSHKWPEGRLPRQAEAVPIGCPAGSVIYFVGLTWHCGGANRAARPRMSMTVQYCQPYIRPIENMSLAVDPRRLADIPPPLVAMLGYAVHRPFIGYVDGLDPLKGAQRMASWLQRPLEQHPPAFAEWPEPADAERQGAPPDEPARSRL